MREEHTIMGMKVIVTDECPPDTTIFLLDAVEYRKACENWIARYFGQPQPHTVDWSKHRVIKVKGQGDV